jgi:sec-independent protein translocase protein TatC
MKSDLVNQLVEIRKRLIYILLGFVASFLLIFHFLNSIFIFVASPLLHYLQTGVKLVATDVLSPFFVPLKLGIIVAVFISLPNTIYQIWKYISPGLYLREKKMILPLIFFGVILFALGVVFCYYLVLPTLFKFVVSVKSINIEMFMDISKYLDFILTLFLVFGISFELPILIICLLYFGIVDTVKLRKFRPYIFVLCFVLAAIVTPPDVFSQSILALSLYVLYELGILSSYFIRK